MYQVYSPLVAYRLYIPRIALDMGCHSSCGWEVGSFPRAGPEQFRVLSLAGKALTPALQSSVVSRRFDEINERAQRCRQEAPAGIVEKGA
jgi:hypothetical protein